MNKKIIFTFIALLLIFPYQIGQADPNTVSERSTAENKIEMNAVGEMASKDEVVYGSLSALGTLNELYVVNMINVTTAGYIIDYGDYTTVRNLTNLSEIEQEDDKVQFEASPGWFYFQGNMEYTELPWDIDISYMLDGEEKVPDDLPGKEGRLSLSIKTTQNESVNPVFYENYTLQISLTLDTDIISNLQAPDATVANVGKKRQLTYTVMPDTEGDISLLADVVDFEMDGIDISAIPLSMVIDDLELDGMTKEMRSLSDAINDIKNGVFELKSGVSELNDGLQSLNEGSSEYHLGLNEMKASSSEIVEVSESIEDSLAMFNKKLSGSSEEMDFSEMDQLSGGLLLIADGLEEVADGLLHFNENYSVAYSSLNDAMKAIPAPAVSEEELQQLYASGENDETIDHLIEVYSAAQTAKGTYDNVKEVFDAVETTLDKTSGSVKEMSSELTSIAKELSSSFERMESLEALSELEEGIGLLSENYGVFHSGLVSYTDGISQLANSYDEIDSGFGELVQGSSELGSGVGELYDGTDELASETSDLPDQMQEEVNSMMDEYDRSDFEPISFVSPKNTSVDSVQFIFKTESIELEEEIITDDVEENPGFWERFRDLFS
ncbi:YhgE/Pip domain-containing protein [Bacillus shivajii]|uniref:YhgE/Pip domain-containing protein n=1 Tax=Bacillus shivajii TaxID=1983719 RepID=UPI001CFA6733|nr:YhgE/Pip domain-containing protein [Bacillus shivajii]UCZ54767.1 YhgE/Pip domain-containing protein [Bacillus shivajii]